MMYLRPYIPAITRQPIKIDITPALELVYDDAFEPGVGGYFFTFFDYLPSSWEQEDGTYVMRFLGALVGLTPPSPRVEKVVWEGYGDWKPAHPTNWDYEHEIELKFYEFKDGWVSGKLLNWIQTARKNDPAGFKANLLVLNFTPDLATVRLALLLIGCFPIQVTLPNDFDIESNELSTASVTINVDRVVFDETGKLTEGWSEFLNSLPSLGEQLTIGA